MPLRVYAILFTLLAICCKGVAPAVQQPYPQTEFLSRQGEVGGATFKYRVYVPANRDKGESLPVMLYLHGAGNRGTDNESQLNGLADIIRGNPTSFDFIVVIPQCDPDGFWDELALRKAQRALDDTVSELNGDAQRLYLAGFSLGGFGVWNLAAMDPKKFAAIVPMAGRVWPRQAEISKVASVVSETSRLSDSYDVLAKTLSSPGVWIFHGADDKVVPLEGSRRMFDALRKAGNTNVRYSEVPGAGHEPLAFRDPAFSEWLGQQRLKTE